MKRSEYAKRRGVTDKRPKLKKLLTNPQGGVLVVEHRDRLTRFGYSSGVTLLHQQGRRVEARSPRDTGDDLVDAVVTVTTTLATRLSGRRAHTRGAEPIKSCVEPVRQSETDA